MARVVIRVDSGTTIGSGHLMRCLNLADELRARAVDVWFVTREQPGHLAGWLEAAGHPVRRLPRPHSRSGGGYATWLGVSEAEDASDTLACLEGTSADWLVVDHYALGAEWERRVRGAGRRILAIDDLANRDHECDVLLDQNYHGGDAARRYHGRSPSSTRCLLGPRYALLSADFARLRAEMRPRGGRLERVFVYFGATDAGNQTGRALEALEAPELAALHVDVVVGPNHPNRPDVAAVAGRRPRTTVLDSAPSLAPLMARADLAIGAGGVTMWERCCLGLPSLVAVIAENQDGATRAMAADGRIVWVGEGATPTARDWREAVNECLANPDRLAELERRAAEVTDGLGVKRVTRALLGQWGLSIAMRRATLSDERLLLEWANDPEVRVHSFNPRRIEADDHARWLRATLADPDTALLIGEADDGLPVGQVRFDVDRPAAEAIVSISVDSSLRSLGVGDALLAAAIAWLRAIEPWLAIVAEVRQDNERSQRLFRRLNFVPRPGRRAGSQVFLLAP